MITPHIWGVFFYPYNPVNKSNNLANLKFLLAGYTVFSSEGETLWISI